MERGKYERKQRKGASKLQRQILDFLGGNGGADAAPIWAISRAIYGNRDAENIESVRITLTKSLHRLKERGLVGQKAYRDGNGYVLWFITERRRHDTDK